MHPQVVARTQTGGRDRHGQTGRAGKLEAGDGHDRAGSVSGAAGWQVRVCKHSRGPRPHAALLLAFPPGRACATSGTAGSCLSSMLAESAETHIATNVASYAIVTAQMNNGP